MKGKLIVLEGTDGSGKKTQFDMLAKKFKQQNIPFETFDFPIYNSFYGRVIGSYLNGEFGDMNRTSPKLISLIYALDRFVVRDKMQDSLKRGKVVLCNRYVASNQAHQSVKIENSKDREEFIKWIDEMEYNVNKLPRPDITIFLHVAAEIAQNLVNNKEKRDYTEKKQDLHEGDLNYLKTVEHTYLKLAELNKWKVVSCVENNNLLSKQEIHQKVWEIIEQLL